jgi:hypothetical protein
VLGAILALHGVSTTKEVVWLASNSWVVVELLLSFSNSDVTLPGLVWVFSSFAPKHSS